MSTRPQPAALPVGAALDGGFALLRRHPRPLLLTQLVLNLVPLVVAAVLVGLGVLLVGDVATHTETVRESTFLGDSTLTREEIPDFTGGQIATLVLLVVIGSIVYAWFLIAAYVSVVRGAERALEGEDALPLGTAARQALAATPRLFGLGIVFGLLWVGALGVGVGIVVALALASPALAVLGGLALFLGVIYAGVRLFLWPIVVLTEDVGFAAFARTWRLTRGRFWSLFGLLLLVSILVSIVYAVVSLLLQLALAGLVSLDDTVGAVALVPYAILVSVLSVVFVAGYLTPLVVAHRALAGKGPAGPEVADAMAGTGARGVPGAAPGAYGTETGWDATEPGLWATPRGDGPRSRGAGREGGGEPGVEGDGSDSDR